MKNNPESFFSACQKANCCDLCRSNLSFRTSLNIIYGIPIDFKCPHTGKEASITVHKTNRGNCVPCGKKKREFLNLLDKAKRVQ